MTPIALLPSGRPVLATAAAAITALVLSLFAAAAPARADVQSKRIEYTVNGKTYEGFLAWDEAQIGKSKRPGILVCPEWWGMNEYAQSRATQLAQQGFIAFALDPYGKGKTTTDPKQAGEWSSALYGDNKNLREVAAAGLKVLADDPHTDSGNLAAIGYCMGGTVALELARSGLPNTANLKAVCCFHTSSLAAKNPADNASIKGSVLVCTGAADTFIKPEEIPSFQKQMADAKIDWEMVTYADATHSFTNPNADKFNIPGIKYNAKADARSWQTMLNLFHEKFPQTAKVGTSGDQKK